MTTYGRQEILRSHCAAQDIDQCMIRNALQVHAGDACYLSQLRNENPMGGGTVLAGQEERHALVRGVGIGWAR